MKRLNLEQRGAYNTVIDLIYFRGGNLDDDDRELAGWMRCDVRVWKRLKAELIEAGKLYIDDGQIRNPRADEVLATYLATGVARENAGRTGGLKSGVARRKINDIDEANDEAKSNKNKNKNKKRSKKEGEGAFAPRSLDDDPVDIAFANYNAMASSSTPPLPVAQSFNATRRRSLALRLAECGGLDGWGVALGKVAASKFCHGQNDRGWIVGLDFMLQQKSFTKLMEGAYDDRKPNGNGKANTIADGWAKVDAVIGELERREAAGPTDDGGVP